MKGNANQDELWFPIEDGDPVELEDKWGKRCPPQFSICMKPEITTIKTQKKNWFQTPLINITIESWIKPKSSSGSIIEIGNGK